MALTQVVRLRLEAAGFNRLYEDHRQDWENLAEQARMVIGGQIQGHQPSVDDIKKVLLPLIEINPHLRTFLTAGRKPLTQLYWVKDFTDYVLERVYQPALQNLNRRQANDRNPPNR